jgi:hypothetical protein
VLASSFSNNFSPGVSGYCEPGFIRAPENLAVRKTYKLGTSFRPETRVIFSQEVEPFISPNLKILASSLFSDSMLETGFGTPVYFFAANRAKVSLLGSRMGSSGSRLVSTCRRAVFKLTNLCGGWADKSIKFISTVFASEFLSGIRVYFSRRHVLPPDSDAPYHHYTTSIVDVYNLEVEDNHHYVANGFVVHNCTDCRRLNGRVYRSSTWRKADLYPRKHTLECKGYRCACEFVLTSKPCTPGFPPRL